MTGLNYIHMSMCISDERLWDAFVSFRSIKRDESFIVHTLRPKLEEELGFKLCLHFRDFIPGASKWTSSLFHVYALIYFVHRKSARWYKTNCMACSRTR